MLSGLCALLVAAGGIHLSRQVQQVAVKPSGNQTEDTFRQVSRRVGELEKLWQSAVEREAKQLLEGKSGDKTSGVHGIVQVSRLNPNFHDGDRAHQRTDGGVVTVKPTLPKHSRNQSGEWLLSDDLTYEGWIENENKQLAWRAGNGRSAVVLLVDPALAAGIVVRDLQGRFKEPPLSPGEGEVSWESPSGKPWMLGIGKPREGTADETLRHVSLFGDWTLRRHYPAKISETHRLPVLAGSLAVASLLLAGGIFLSVWQYRATRRAEQQVSFANRVSHELRTPLTNLLLNTDLALDGLHGDEAKARRRLRLIREETSRLSRIVDNVQTFSRMRHGLAAPASHAACDVGRLARDVMENFAPLFARKGIRVTCDCGVNGPLPVDPDALSQILSNLLSNIEKYTGQDSLAEMTIRHANELLAVEVRDNGPGIPSGAERRIFQPFERAGTKVNEGATGTGLGLAISRELAEQAGGSLVLLATAKGAGFRLEIPVKKGPDL